MSEAASRQYDVDLKPTHVQSIADREQVAGFFSLLGWDVSGRIRQEPELLGVTAEGVKRNIHHCELVADAEGLFHVYLFELKSITLAARDGIARVFRDKVPNCLLVLTTRDYDQVDFVLLERVLRKPTQSSGPTGGAAQTELRVRSISVDRRRPSRVDLRVLRRFTWTEPDPYYQFDKVRAAYEIAQWSEEFFNNRALFSDHYLLTRLREREEWHEDPKPAFSRVQTLMREARRAYSNQSENLARGQLLEPILRGLGFQAVPGKHSKSDASEPDYRLCGPGGGGEGEPVALCLAYAWDRSLDSKDEQRDKETSQENPAFVVVSLLERGEAPWVIVTNGRIWRLYASAAHARATSFYEIDLEEATASVGAFSPEIGESFRYFWLLFRRQAFEPKEVVRDGRPQRLSLLDTLLLESEDYAKELGESLKDRVFLQVFPHIAEGLIAHLAPERSARLDLAERELATVYRAALTLLYRLLFIQYAEARDLLPVKETRGYWEISLDRLKREIAEVAKRLPDEAERLIDKHFAGDSHGLHDRMMTLFDAIEGGRADLNLPFYNGGLFNSNPAADDRSEEAEAIRFLTTHRISDRYLAGALNHLTRDRDTKSGELVFIDFKSLGVRQLGSIYEGLLEFKVRIATRPLGAVRKKDRDVYVPSSELSERERDRAKREGRWVSRGDVYLENDNHERKATGSYYTPDHIVKFIVEQAVGPVLHERLEALRPRMREAQEWHRKRVAAAPRKGEAPDKYESGVVVEQERGALVDDVFGLTVLDPAMGSGHFLVEAVDYLSDRLIGFLNAFPWNPVTSRLQMMRESIVGGLREQGVSVPPERLTDVNLLKRHVLKRCIYGVDFNPMAVELAKVSLWLDCFTLGAPLSFLDHHLRCGNSLIGVTVDEVKAAAEPGTRIEEVQRVAASAREWKTVTHQASQLSMFESHFAGLLLATDLMRQVGDLSDVTSDQVQLSRAHYRRASDELAPFKRALDLYASQWFGNGVPPGRNRRSDASTEAVAFLKSAESSALLAARDAANARTAIESLPAKARQVADTAIAAATDKRFFHWQLEFPEVFYAKGQAVTAPGFDAVIGNPPYDVLASEELGVDLSEDLAFFESYPLFKPAIRGKKNLYKLFVCRALELTHPKGRCSFIVPMAILGDDQAAGVRRKLLEERLFVSADSFPQKDDPKRRVFPEAKLSTAVFVARGSGQQSTLRVVSHPGKRLDEMSGSLTLQVEDVTRFDPENGAIPSCSQGDWELAMRVLKLPGVWRLGSVAVSFQGEVNETNERARKAFTAEPSAPLVLRGSNICLYALRGASQGEDLRLNVTRFLAGKGTNTKSQAFRCERVGFQRSSPQNNFRRIVAAPIPAGQFCFDTVSYIPPQTSRLGADLLLALLNSAFLDWYFRLGSTNSKVNEYQFNALPCPTVVDRPIGSAWQPLLRRADWEALVAWCTSNLHGDGQMPADVAEAMAAMSRRIQDLEAERTLDSRSDRSHLTPEAQPIQEAIDAVLFGCFGLTPSEGDFIKGRLKEML